MADWKRLTAESGVHVDVNMDQVAYMVRSDRAKSTSIYLAVTKDKALGVVSVKETPDEIHRARLVISAG
jgi:hypothetical protein